MFESHQKAVRLLGEEAPHPSGNRVHGTLTLVAAHRPPAALL
jgi:hypothetical protein